MKEKPLFEFAPSNAECYGRILVLGSDSKQYTVEIEHNEKNFDRGTLIKLLSTGVMMNLSPHLATRPGLVGMMMLDLENALREYIEGAEK